MKNGIVILNYNDSENTSLILEDIKNYKNLDTIVIVDNKSTDDSVEKLKKWENNKIKLLIAEENRGYAAGNNIGIRYLLENTKVDNIIISNPDIIVLEKDIDNLVKNLEKEKVSVIAPRIKEPIGISRGWKLPTFTSELISNIPFVRKFEQNILSYKEEEYKKNLTEVEVVKGCFFIIKRKVLEEIGLFDENTFLYYEEVILAKKLQEKGYRTFVDNHVEIVHALSKSIDKSAKRIQKFKYLKQSQFYYEKYINHLNIFKLSILKILAGIYLLGLEIEKIIRRWG